MSHSFHSLFNRGTFDRPVAFLNRICAYAGQLNCSLSLKKQQKYNSLHLIIITLCVKSASIDMAYTAHVVLLICLTFTHLLGLLCALAEMVQYEMARYKHDQRLLVPVSTLPNIVYGTIVPVCRYAGLVFLVIATWKLPSLYRKRWAVPTLPISSVCRETVLYVIPLFVGCVALVARLIVLLLNSSCKDCVLYHVTIDDVVLAFSCYFTLISIFLWVVYMILIMYKKIQRYELEEMQANAAIKVPVIVTKQTGCKCERSTKFQYPVKDKTLLISVCGV
ncbi:hypothetical protein DPMN_102051 [Dreissena polymorpha]|uniref:Uncharacterized protein n=1 Tax=Dreissena polymorpha TaxID=45954 RepID=A0A9D4LKX4_DREPO|nr:hypothetical protein DPMN_102051 [Dreissena polymorpha]